MSDERLPPAPVPPRATYRLQLRGGFTFRAAERVIPYLSALGVSHVYSSPFVAARSGSEHGYDVTDPRRLDPSLGDDADFDAFCETLRSHGMGLVVDWVPNHVGIGGADNAFWLDVLEYGRESPYADFFDIEWEPARIELRGKVLVPLLGDHYGALLEGGELVPAFDAGSGSLSVFYHEHRFPIAPRRYAEVLDPAPARLEGRLGPGHPTLDAWRAVMAVFAGLPARARSARGRVLLRERAENAKRELAALVAREPVLAAYLDEVLADLRGRRGEPASFRPLHRLLERQHYRLAYWRVAADEINYRRFFDVNELAGLRMERREVFDWTHETLFRWMEQGRVQGLRIDHVDGLVDPLGYCRHLRERFGDRPLGLWVEKILATHERLREDWPVDGTTGYEFLNLVNGLFVDPAGESPLDRIHRAFTGERESFDDLLYGAKKHVMNFLLGSELQVLANEADRLGERDWRTRDFTLTSLREALKEIVACFGVYRSYVDANGAEARDLEEIDAAVDRARARSSDPETSLFEWLRGVLSARPTGRPAPAPRRRDLLPLAVRFQQYTAPVTAKGLEDTAFYRYPRLVSLNEVGGDPRMFGVTVEDFHAANARRAARWPASLVTTATHDTKRGEDARARIDVLSELPDAWEEHLRRWSALNLAAKTRVDGRLAPDPEHELLLYQVLLGSWPAAWAGGADPDADGLADLAARVEGCLVKSVREGKRASSWRHPHPAYEEALARFVARLLDADPANPFLADFAPFAARVACLGAQNGLSQLLIKLTAPGVPDLYQGSELWELSMVDPDNRRPVDYAARATRLAELDRVLSAAPATRAAAIEGLLCQWADGSVKMLVTRALLDLRQRRPALFRDGAYRPLSADGVASAALCAFAREHDDEAVVVLAPRLCAALPRADGRFPLGEAAWRDTALPVPSPAGPQRWRHVVTGEVTKTDARGRLPVRHLLGRFPVAALEPAP